MPELNEENVWSLTFDNWKSREEVSGRQKIGADGTERKLQTTLSLMCLNFMPQNLQ